MYHWRIMIRIEILEYQKVMTAVRPSCAIQGGGFGGS